MRKLLFSREGVDGEELGEERWDGIECPIVKQLSRGADVEVLLGAKDKNQVPCSW